MFLPGASATLCWKPVGARFGIRGSPIPGLADLAECRPSLA